MTILKDHFENYINECKYVKRLSPVTLRTSSDAFRYFCEMMPEVKMDTDISHAIVTVFFKRLHAREKVNKGVLTNLKDSTVYAYAGRLKTFFKWLKDRKHVEHNPFEAVRLPPPSYVDHRSLTGEEIRRLIGAVVQMAQNSFIMKRDIAMISVLTFCGLRRNELVSLEMRDVDLYQGLLTVRAETSKSKRLRKIPINLHLKFQLSEYFAERKKCGYTSSELFVAHKTGNGLTIHGLKHWVDKLIKASSVKFHVHRFRHTFATNLAMQNVGAIKIQKLMGHTDIKMTQTYLRSVSTEEMQDDINTLSFETLA